MAVAVLDQVREKASEDAQAARERIVQLTTDTARTAAAVLAAVNDGLAAAKRTAEHTYLAAEELAGEVPRRVKERPVTWVGAAFGIGLFAGWVVGRFVPRK